MKAMKNLLTALFCITIPMLTANCSEKKSVESNAPEAKKTTIDVQKPPFLKFVVVTVEESAIYKNAEKSSPTLWRLLESDCESDDWEERYQWSDKAVPEGFEVSTDLMACEGTLYAVLGEQGNFYKVCVLSRRCDVESGFIPKADVGDIEWKPIEAGTLNYRDGGMMSRILNDGKYKNVVLADNEDELYGENLQVGVLLDGIIATPLNYSFECQIDQNEKNLFEIENKNNNHWLYYGTASQVVTEEGDEYNQLDLNKLSSEQIEKIVGTVTKTKPARVEYTYHFPPQRLQYFYWDAE